MSESGSHRPSFSMSLRTMTSRLVRKMAFSALARLSTTISRSSASEGQSLTNAPVTDQAAYAHLLCATGRVGEPPAAGAGVVVGVPPPMGTLMRASGEESRTSFVFGPVSWRTTRSPSMRCVLPPGR